MHPSGHRTVEEADFRPFSGGVDRVGATGCVVARAVALFFEACSTFAPALDTASRGDTVRVNSRISMPAMIHPFAGCRS
jgi:hypothetical protein